MKKSLFNDQILESLHDDLKTIWPELQVIYKSEVESTNLLIKKKAKSGDYAPPLLLLAGEQTAGRGRRQRSWYSPAGGGLYFSLLLEPEVAPEDLYIYTVLASLSIQHALQYFGYDADIKWPNDILLSDSKLAGILSELLDCNDRDNLVIIGSGINTHIEEFPREIADRATSLVREEGMAPPVEALMSRIITEFRTNLGELTRQEAREDLHNTWVDALGLEGCKIKIRTEQGLFSGTVQGISERGELIIDREGSRLHLDTGDIMNFYNSGEK